MYKLLHITQTSITVELNNKLIYFNDKPYDVYLNDKKVLKDVKTNVFSLYNLEPDTNYRLRIDEVEKHFTTKEETCLLNVKDFFAIGDGKKDDTQAIQLAIDSCLPGGRVYIPAGTYLVKPLFLRSNVTIELAKDALILGSKNQSDYPVLPPVINVNDGTRFELSSWEGESLPTHASVFTGINVENVSIIGEGVINCSGFEGGWWENPKEIKGNGFRPKGIYLTNSKDILLQGITVKNTPSWNIHPFFCENIKVLDIKLESPKDSPNTDGCNPEFCTNVEIIGVNFSVGDDCIALKSGKIELGARYKKATENVTIRNCYMAFGHGAVVLGSEISGGIKNISVTQCYFESTDRGLRIKTRRGRGKDSIIDEILFENIYMNNVLAPLTVNMFYFCDWDGKTEYVWSKEPLKLDERTPYIGRFKFKDIVCDNVHSAAGYFYGLPEQTIKKIELENVVFNYAKDPQPFVPAMMSFLEPMAGHGLVFNNVDEVILRNVEVNVTDKPEIEKDNVGSLIVE